MSEESEAIEDGEGGNEEINTDAPKGNWRDELPDELKGAEALANFEDVTGLAKGFLDAKAYQGASIRVPGEDAGDEDRKIFVEKLMKQAPNLMIKPDFENPDQSFEFWRSIGMPETAEQYSTPEFEPPEGVEVNTHMLSAFKEIAHKHGLTAAQYKGVISELVTQDMEENRAVNERMQENVEAVKEKFGMAYKENMGKIFKMLDKTDAPESLVEAVKKGVVSPDTVNWMYSMGKQMGGEGFDFGDDDGQDVNRREAAMTPEEAKAAIDEINRNPDHPYWVGRGEEKKRATEHMIKLMRFAHPPAA